MLPLVNTRCSVQVNAFLSLWWVDPVVMPYGLTNEIKPVRGFTVQALIS